MTRTFQFAAVDRAQGFHLVVLLVYVIHDILQNWNLNLHDDLVRQRTMQRGTSLINQAAAC